jgi:2-keto-4-pentenoate hydratase/2-oxohepta-3-ene-1,7-dioic acid hydratase in catechol pathway
MKLITYKTTDSLPRLGIMVQDQVFDAESLGRELSYPIPSSMLELIDMGENAWTEINRLVKSASPEKNSRSWVPFDLLSILAPIPKPRKNIFGIGLNYTEHVAESARSLDTSKELPQKPVIFSKPPTAVIGPDTNIIHNQDITQQLDHEVELAVVMGKRAKNVKKENALDFVFGYTIINDISARDCRRAGQWIVSKGQDTFAPMGPVLLTKDDIKDPHNLQLSLKLNGVEKQNSNTRFMLFSIEELIEDLSTVFTLEPGDIIATGTPAGVGAGKNPPEWMWPGDVVEATVEGIGTLRNTILDEKNHRN